MYGQPLKIWRTKAKGSNRRGLHRDHPPHKPSRHVHLKQEGCVLSTQTSFGKDSSCVVGHFKVLTLIGMVVLAQ